LNGSDEDILPLEFTDPARLKSNKHLIILYPVHGFNAPRTVKRFVKVLPPGLFDHVSLIGVGSMNNWLNGAVSSELRKPLGKNGYQIVVDEMLAMPLTFIMNTPEDSNLRVIAESEKQIAVIGKSIREQTVSAYKVQGRSYVTNFMGKIESPAGRLFGLELHANSNCNSCGTCWNNCPESNIKQKSSGKP